jgi:hypothetical protein
MIKNKMALFSEISDEIVELVSKWENKLLLLPQEVIAQRRNSQDRTIRQIVGHMVDSASNNTHRVVHLQYQPSPFEFPNYATLGNNDRWIAIQNYQDEDWTSLVQLWKYSLLHFAHVIKNVDETKLDNEWIAGADRKISLQDIILDFNRHLNLHLSEVEELISDKK